MKSFRTFFLLALIVLTPLITNAQEQDNQLYRVFPNDFISINNIEMTGVNVFNSSVDNYIDIIATPDQIKKLRAEGFQIDFLANNFKELVGKRLKTGSFNDYHNHQETLDLLNQLASNFPDITKLDTIAYSVLGREICCIKISDNPDEDEDETPILMVGNHHGNEVLSVEATLYQIDFLVNNYGVDTEVTQWIDNMEIWYVPMVNPDGREDIRRTNDNGVDLNRNYDSFHTAVGNHGPYGFSEPETQAIRDLSAKYPPVMSLTYHTSGRLVLLPWTHTDDSAPDSLALSYLGNKIAESITFPQGGGTGHYELRQGGDWYFTAGEYCDYMYGTHNTQAYTIEMWTSQTPDAEVIPQVIERNLEGMKTMLRQAGRAGITGRITDKLTGEPVVAEISFSIIDDQGKLAPHLSNELYGRYHKYTTPGSYEMVFTAPGYRTITREITISEDSMFIMDLEMDPSPELEFRSFELNDNTGNRIVGNGDGHVNIGETPGIFLTLYNDQLISAESAYVRVSSKSPYVNLITDSLYFGTIAHYSEVQSMDTLLFTLDPNCPDVEILYFHFAIGDNVGLDWEGDIEIDAYTPSIKVTDMIINDERGNQNGIIDNGESVTMKLELENSGRQDISDVVLTFTTSDPYFSVQAEPVHLSQILINNSVSVEFQVDLGLQAPAIYSSYLTVNISSSESYEDKLKIPVSNILGFKDDFENGENGWSHASYGTTSNNHDDWQLGIPQGKAGDPASSFSGSNCWGTDLGFELYLGEYWNGEYQNNVHNYLESPPIDCSNMTDVGLRYRRWLNTRSTDIGRIMVNGNQVWKSSARGHSDQEWFEHLIDISEFADGNPEVRIKFEMQTSGANALGGWNIDDFLVANKLASGSTSVEYLNEKSSDAISCYPNPFNQRTTLEFTLESAAYVEALVMDTQGKIVKNLISRHHQEGEHSIIWDATNNQNHSVRNGIYFLKLKYGSNVLSKTLILIR